MSFTSPDEIPLPTYEEAVSVPSHIPVSVPAPTPSIPTPTPTPAAPTPTPAAAPIAVFQNHVDPAPAPVPAGAVWEMPDFVSSYTFLHIVFVITMSIVALLQWVGAYYVASIDDGLLISLLPTLCGWPIVSLAVWYVGGVFLGTNNRSCDSFGLGVAVLFYTIATLGTATIVGCVYISVVGEIDSPSVYADGPVPHVVSPWYDKVAESRFQRFTNMSMPLDVFGVKRNKDEDGDETSVGTVVTPIVSLHHPRQVVVLACACRQSPSGCRSYPSIPYGGERLWYQPLPRPTVRIDSKIRLANCKKAAEKLFGSTDFLSRYFPASADSVIFVELADLPKTRRAALDIALGVGIPFTLLGLIQPFFSWLLF